MSLSKKLIAIIAAMVLVLSMVLVGCGNNSNNSSGSNSSNNSSSSSSSSGNNSSGNTSTNSLKLVKEGTLTIGSDCDYPPFIILEGNKPVGFEYDLMEAIAADMGLKLEYLPPQNFDTLIAAVAGGTKMDLAVSSLTITD